MDSASEDKILLQRLEELRAAARRLKTGDGRLIMALRNDIQTLRVSLHRRRDEIARELNIAGTKTMAMNAYARMATMGRLPFPAKTRSTPPE